MQKHSIGQAPQQENHRQEIFFGGTISRVRSALRPAPVLPSTSRSAAEAGATERGPAAERAGRRRPSRAWIEQLQSELAQVRAEALQKDLDAAVEMNARLNELNDVRIKLEKEQMAVRDAEKAQQEAERLSLERLRELGFLHARGIMAWAELRAVTLNPNRRKMGRFELWKDILSAKESTQLRQRLVDAGWPAGQLPSNMVGLYASLSQEAHPDATPRVTQLKGGIKIEVEDSGSGMRTTTGKVLLCLADANFLKASLRVNGKDFSATRGLDDPISAAKFEEEEKQFWVFLDSSFPASPPGDLRAG